MKKQFNKKWLMFGLPILGLMVVSAALTYYAVFSVAVTVNQPIDVDGNLEQSVNCNVGSVCLGTPITISNDANSNKVVVLTDDNEDENIDVSYVGKLDLVAKDLDDWEQHPETRSAKIIYTILNDEFMWRYVSSKGFDRDKYTLIYYKDNDANADDADRLMTLGESSGFSHKLPQTNDWNEGVEANYCDGANGFDSYEHCKGAKLWLVPTEAITGNTVDWTKASQFLFETDLIWYSYSETDLIVPANSFIELYPQFTVDKYTEGGTNTISITVA